MAEPPLQTLSTDFEVQFILELDIIHDSGYISRAQQPLVANV